MNQDISTGLYQGVPEIEIAIIKEVGSFGLQLGIISEAVKELAETVGAMPPERSAQDRAKLDDASRDPTPLEKLDDLIRDVNRVKEACKEAVERDAERSLKRLDRVDPQASTKLTERFR